MRNRRRNKLETKMNTNAENSNQNPSKLFHFVGKIIIVSKLKILKVSSELKCV